MDKEELDRFVEATIKEKEAEYKAQTEYAKEKGKQEAKELAAIAKDPTSALQTKLNSKVVEHIDSSKEVAERISHTADKLVDKGLKAQENKATANMILSEDETLEADFQKNKSEYLYHGIDHKIDKKWKRSIIHVINDIWFVIWAIVSAFTIVPISTFLSRICALKGFLKVVAIILGVAMLLACLWGLTYGCLKWAGVINF